jgi:peptidoglycan hydrolase CwlO-like protein
MRFIPSFREFASDPVKGMLAIMLMAIMYLYVDNRNGYKDQIARQDERIETLEEQVRDLQNQLLETINKLDE